MKRYVRLIGIPFIIAVCIFLFIKFVWLKEFKFMPITIDQYVELYNSNDEGIIYVSDNKFDKTAEFEATIKNVFQNKKVTVYMLNLTDISDLEHQKFVEISKFPDNSFIVPMILYIKDGVIMDSIEGYALEDKVKEFVEKNNIE